ncbi:MAG: zf-HC2 domain-containing protein [Sphingobacteriales bacterium]|nr:MAG: zf-HC2 domain-containing protein [Sphingobacteriales bacterium]
MSDLNDIWNSGKGKLPEEKLQAYLEGKLSAEESREVELWLSEEGMESDAAEGLSELPPGDTNKIVGKLNADLNKTLASKRKRRTKAIGENKWGWVAIIVILLLCILAYFVINVAV